MPSEHDQWKLRAADDDLEPEEPPESYCRDCGGPAEYPADQCEACARDCDHADSLNDEAAVRE